MAWVYEKSEAGLWTVGFYGLDMKWNSDSDHDVREEAARRVHWLNGGCRVEANVGKSLGCYGCEGEFVDVTELERHEAETGHNEERR